MLDADSDRADLELRLTRLWLTDRARSTFRIAWPPSCNGPQLLLNVAKPGYPAQNPKEVMSPCVLFRNTATNLTHKGVTQLGGKPMRTQRVRKTIQPETYRDSEELHRLHAELAVFNKQIAELEDAHPEKQKIEMLKAGAILLARRIDEVR
ncbi:MAG: hypothetical protein KGK01_18260, partial [Bradyrhizobium sp.]|nr:hypothetical protein [Bradyrhizobium sp.]